MTAKLEIAYKFNTFQSTRHRCQCLLSCSDVKSDHQAELLISFCHISWFYILISKTDYEYLFISFKNTLSYKAISLFSLPFSSVTINTLWFREMLLRFEDAFHFLRNKFILHHSVYANTV